MLDPKSMADRVKAKISAATGMAVSDGLFNVLLFLCQGIVEEIQQNAEVDGITSAPAAPIVAKVK